MNQQARTLVQKLRTEEGDNRPDSSMLLTGTQPDASTIGNAHWGEDGIYWRYPTAASRPQHLLCAPCWLSIRRTR
jgi:hypothetical protein